MTSCENQQLINTREGCWDNSRNLLSGLQNFQNFVRVISSCFAEKYDFLKSQLKRKNLITACLCKSFCGCEIRGGKANDVDLFSVLMETHFSANQSERIV